jgi:hypothetical protein
MRKLTVSDGTVAVAMPLFAYELHQSTNAIGGFLPATRTNRAALRSVLS